MADWIDGVNNIFVRVLPVGQDRGSLRQNLRKNWTTLSLHEIRTPPPTVSCQNRRSNRSAHCGCRGLPIPTTARVHAGIPARSRSRAGPAPIDGQSGLNRQVPKHARKHRYDHIQYWSPGRKTEDRRACRETATRIRAPVSGSGAIRRKPMS